MMFGLLLKMFHTSFFSQRSLISRKERYVFVVSWFHTELIEIKISQSFIFYIIRDNFNIVKV